MTRKDFQLIADAIRTSRAFSSIEAKTVFADDMCEHLSQTNPRFDRERFIKACLPDIYHD